MRTGSEAKVGEENSVDGVDAVVGPDGIVGPVAGTRVPRFAGRSTFARLPRVDEVPDYSVAVLGAPFDVRRRHVISSRCSVRARRGAAGVPQPAAHLSSRPRRGALRTPRIRPRRGDITRR